MNIYFCGSIRGGRQDAALYHDMIVFLKQYGDVLTEHVGDLRLTEQGNDGTADAIWQRDTEWLRQSNIVIAECSTPSLGVGYELAYAEARGVPCYLFYRRSETQLSAMLTGDDYFHIFPYETKEDIFRELDTILER